MADVLNVTNPERPFSVDDLAELGVDDHWPRWRKTSITAAIRVAGPFKVATSEGELSCADGYLAVDARGYPYPIAVDEFELIYAPAGDERAGPPDHGSRIARLGGGSREPLNLHVTYRGGEWSATFQWQAPFATAGDSLAPASAHANGATLEQALANVLEEAERLTAS